MIAEAAITGTLRYEWHLLSPVLHCLLDVALEDFPQVPPVEIGPLKPMPDGQSFEAARSALHSLLDRFDAPPFTWQRLCELLLEPRKHYQRIEKLMFAIERLLLVTSTLEVDAHPGPRPTLGSLGPVNENPRSPYANEPIAQPAPPLTQPHGVGADTSLVMGEYVFASTTIETESFLNKAEAMEGEDRAQAPLAAADELQAEAFVKAALAGGSSDHNVVGEGVGVEHEKQEDLGNDVMMTNVSGTVMGSSRVPELNRSIEMTREDDLPKTEEIPEIYLAVDQENNTVETQKEGLVTPDVAGGATTRAPVHNDNPVGVVVGVPMEVDTQSPTGEHTSIKSTAE